MNNWERRLRAQCDVGHGPVVVRREDLHKLLVQADDQRKQLAALPTVVVERALARARKGN